jgi:acyl-CoA thioesterase-1
VILELGANDGLRGLNLSQTRANLEHIIQRFMAGGATVILAGMKLPPNYGVEYTHAFHSMYVDLAKRYGLPFIPFFLQGVAAKAHLNQADGIHPTGAGYAIIVQNAWPIIEPLLKK